ncbi:MAG: hypothetical protein ACREE9_08470 [Stellaceae bacterium]
MRSLWRMIASRWLGGQGSDGLTGDSALLDLLTIAEPGRAAPAFQVRRQSEISHRAMMSGQDHDRASPDPVLEESSRGQGSH